MFLERVFSGKNDIGRWLALILIVMIAFHFIGLIPLGSLMFLRLNDNPDLIPDPENILDFTSYEISTLTGLALILIPFVTGIIALFSLIKPVHERPVISLLTGSHSFRWNKLIWGMAIWLLFLCIYAFLGVITGMHKIQLQYQPQYLIPLILISFFLMTLKAGFEETFFRGYLMQGFTNLFLNRWTPVFLSAILFGVFQYFTPENKAFGQSVLLPHLIWFGIVLGICTVMDDGLEIALGIHMINNIFYSILFTPQTNAIPAPSIFSTDINPGLDFPGLVIISVLFMLLSKKKYSWPDWSYLFSKIEKPARQAEEEFTSDYGLVGDYEEEDEN